MKKVFKIILIFTGAFLLIVYRDKLRFQILGRNASAVGDLTIDWGVLAGQPLFNIPNFLPGEKAEKEITIINNTAVVQPVGVRGIKTADIGSLPTVLDLVISQNGTDLYGGTTGGKALENFFTDSAGPDGIFLFNLNPAESRKVKFLVIFLESAGNEFQETSVVFDLVIGGSFLVPEECRYLRFDKIIYGTSRRDNLHGANGNDLIFGLEGNDRIDGSNGNDCLVGGLGNDIIDGSNGNDVILGNEGNDRINGSNGNDRIFGGNGNDIVDASNGDDYVEGNEGDDKIYGKNGNDELTGGAGNDYTDGGLGKDRCEAEQKKNCEL